MTQVVTCTARSMQEQEDTATEPRVFKETFLEEEEVTPIPQPWFCC